VEASLARLKTDWIDLYQFHFPDPLTPMDETLRALDDLVRLIVHAVATPGLDGPVNAVAPTPVTNRAFAQALGRALGRPALLAAPTWPLRAALGDFWRAINLSTRAFFPRARTEQSHYSKTYPSQCNSFSM
jgi:NAD dependent epimerase/dehydratase family enzyme